MKYKNNNKKKNKYTDTNKQTKNTHKCNMVTIKLDYNQQNQHWADVWYG